MCPVQCRPGVTHPLGPPQGTLRGVLLANSLAEHLPFEAAPHCPDRQQRGGLDLIAIAEGDTAEAVIFGS